MADGGQEGIAATAALQAIPLTVAEAPAAETPPPRRRWARVPRIVDYLIVAAFMFFFW